MKNKLHLFNLSVFLQTQIFMLPVLLLFYQHNGLTVGDFFLFQGIFSLSALLFEIPMGYLGDIFSKRNVLILSYAFFIMRLLLWLFFAHYGYWILLFGEILYAAQKASFAGASDSYIYDYLTFKNMPNKMIRNYGKMNFFMSLGVTFSSLMGAGIYAAVSEYSLEKYNYNYGFTVLIAIELILNLTAVSLLFFLPKLPQTTHNQTTIINSYKKLFSTITWTMKNKDIRYHIFYSGLLAAISVVFIWSFQPIMKLLFIPVYLYGFAYFLNHLFRAISSLCADKIKSFFSLSGLGALVFFLFSLGFIFTFAILNFPSTPIWLAFLYFAFISLAIGAQLAFYLINVGRLHTFIPPQTRTTSSSVNVAVGRLFAGFFFILIKILLDGESIQTSLGICFVIFLITSFVIKKRYNLYQRQEKAS